MKSQRRWVVWLSSDNTGEVSFYGLFRDFERAESFANRINKRISRERTDQDQDQDFWFATVRDVKPPTMGNVASDGWVRKRSASS